MEIIQKPFLKKNNDVYCLRYVRFGMVRGSEREIGEPSSNKLSDP